MKYFFFYLSGSFQCVIFFFFATQILSQYISCVLIILVASGTTGKKVGMISCSLCNRGSSQKMHVCRDCGRDICISCVQQCYVCENPFCRFCATTQYVISVIALGICIMEFFEKYTEIIF